MKEIKELVIYFFSGTGNAKKAATWIAEIAAEKQIPVRIIDISKIDRKHIPPPAPGSIIGFCSPTHGFNFPPVMMNFIFRFPGAKGNRVFLMNTRAGLKLYKIFIPGGSGIALLLAAFVLLLKGYKIRGMRPVDLPSNWISLHPGVRQKAIVSMFNKWQIKTMRFASRMLDGKRDYRALVSFPVDLACGILAFFYYIFGRFLFAKSFYASRACNNCGICIKQCPVKAISLVDDRPFWSYRCESCMHCMNICPERALETAHGYIIGFLILMNALMQSFVYIWLLTHNIHWFSDNQKYGSAFRFMFSTGVSFIALILSYRLIHYLRKIKVFDMLILYSSFTHYKFWRRYKPDRNLKK